MGRPSLSLREVELVHEDDGRLYCRGYPFYVFWMAGCPFATLDGDFTAVELRAIADHMERR